MAAGSQTHEYRLGSFRTTVEFHDVDVRLSDLLVAVHSDQLASATPTVTAAAPPPPAGHDAAVYATATAAPPAAAPDCQAVYVIDSAVKQAHALPDFPCQHVLAVHETAKSMESVRALLRWLCDQRVRRTALVHAIGGGVLGDLAAFVASIYQRGIAIHIYPTTLLAMVDASFGGKTGVNYAGYKNMVGSFYPARRIVIAPQALSTLPAAELLNGLAEAIKSAMLGDEELFGLLRLRRRELTGTRDLSLLRRVVQCALAVKARLVVDDFTEQGQRALLNLGHTFAHALESSGRFADISHGAAVAWGIAQALRLGRALGMTEHSYAETVWQLLAEYGYRLTIAVDWSELVSLMQHDKKSGADTIRFIIPCALTENRIIALAPERAHALLMSAPPLAGAVKGAVMR